MGTMESEQFFLKWNNFENNLTSGFADLLQQEAMVDVTLAAEGKIIQAHKIILSICSSYFRNMFQLNPCQHPIVVLKDVGYQELTDMLDFMYKGEANVRQEDLPSFLKLAETLKVKGLAGNPVESPNENLKKYSQSQMPNLTKYALPDERQDSVNDPMDENSLVKKKTKRLISPYKNSAIRSSSYSQNIKLEIDEYSDNYLENHVGKVEDCGTASKGERLSENSLYSNEYNIGRNEKDAGPSNLENHYEATPQDVISNPSELGFIESCFGGRLLILQGYCYRRKSSGNEKSYWFCVKAKCAAKGILRSDGTFCIRHAKHNHKPDFEEIQKRKKLLELKNLALTEAKMSGRDLLKSLNIRKDLKKYLGFIRSWRYRRQKQDGKMGSPINVGSKYELLGSRIPSKRILFYLGYSYRQDSMSKSEDCKYWRCVFKTCKARGKTDKSGNLILFKSEHSHPPRENRKGNSIEMVVDVEEETRRFERNGNARLNATAEGENKEIKIEEKLNVFQVKKRTPGASFLATNDTEVYSIEKLMAETLNDNFQDDMEF